MPSVWLLNDYDRAIDRVAHFTVNKLVIALWSTKYVTVTLNCAKHIILKILAAAVQSFFPGSRLTACFLCCLICVCFFHSACCYLMNQVCFKHLNKIFGLVVVHILSA